MQSQDQYCHICKAKCNQTLCKNCYVPLFTSVENHKSFAFLKDIKEIEHSQLNNSQVLDYFKCDLIKAEIVNFSQLRHLRISHCENLTKIELKNLPKLISFDAFYSPNLTEFIISDTPNLIAIDLSYCLELTEINGDLSNIEYFSISHTKIEQLPSLPNAKFVDISSTKITDIKPLFSSQKLQKLITLENNQIEAIEVKNLIQLNNFTSIASSSILDFKDCTTKHSLKNIQCTESLINIENVDLSHTNIDCNNSLQQPHLNFESPICSGDWFESYRPIYGPYPTPPNDSKPFLSDEDLESISGVYDAPPEIDRKLASHHIMGSLFGAAIGDCLGMFCEGKKTVKINFFNDQPLDITWTHPIKSRHSPTSHRGAFTDDSALMLTFLRAAVATALKNKKQKSDTDDITKEEKLLSLLDVSEAAVRIHHWIEHGVDEHLDDHGHGRGGFTTGVVRTNGFDSDPISVSKSKWEETGRTRASNGGVMRTAGCGCLLFWDEAAVISTSKRFCQVTHYDPRCVFSSVLVSLIISRLIRWRCGLLASFDLDDTIDEVKRLFTSSQENSEGEFIDDFTSIEPFLRATSLDELRLTDKEVPRTINTMGCALWVLRMGLSYEEGIERVIRAGGDTDTNAAVAGAVLGAKWGFSGIPLHITDFFWFGGILYRDAVPFLRLMGLEFKPPTYEEITQFTYS